MCRSAIKQSLNMCRSAIKQSLNMCRSAIKQSLKLGNKPQTPSIQCHGRCFILKKERGSIILTLIIIAIFVGAGIFYVKTSHPTLYQRAVSCIKNGSLETVSNNIYDSVIPSEKKTQNISFDYIDEYSVVNVCHPLEEGTLTSPFGERCDPVTRQAGAYHHGIDIGAREGESVLCYKSGIVADAGFDSIYGNFVRVEHGDISTFYAHMSEILVKSGDNLSAGDVIGKVGSTGKSTGAHLHFEIIKEGEAVDPLRYL